MNILILGGTKFVGPHVTRRLAERGHDVTIFHRGETETDLPSSVRHVHGDFSAFAHHVDQLRALSPEVVLDMVPFREEDAQRLKSFKVVARRVVAISSAGLYGRSVESGVRSRGHPIRFHSRKIPPCAKSFRTRAWTTTKPLLSAE